jgi:hypothetical protein
MSINNSQIRDLLLPGLYAITGIYEEIPTQWDHVFDKGVSKMALERSVEARYLGLAAVKNEGGATKFDNAAGERFIYNQSHLEIGLGYAITRKAIDDNLYKEKFNPMNLGLARSFAQTKEIIAASVLNTATTYNSAVLGDGVALCSTAHPVDGGTYANRFTTDLDLNESAIEAATTQIRQFVDQANTKIFARARKLVVPIQLRYVAERLTKTELRAGTNNNDVNAIMTTGSLPDGYQVMDFLTSSFAWFVRTDKEGLNYMERVPFETDLQVDPITGNLLVIGYERYSAGYNDPRAIFGSFPTS